MGHMFYDYMRSRKVRRLGSSCLVALLVLLALLLVDLLVSSPVYDAYGDVDDTTVKCRKQTNIVYIKMIKSASETLQSIFNRFGHARNLSFVLPVGNRIYLGWPYPMRDDDFRPQKRGYNSFNLLSHHAVYNADFFEKLMPRDTVYVTSLREPFSQFKSTFHYYDIQQISGVPQSRAISEYLRNTDKYELIYQSHTAKNRHCIPDNFTMTKNLMSFILGFPLGYPPGSDDISRSDLAVDAYLHTISQKLEIVIIVEYFIESIVLMRRTLCWSVKDVLYYTRNVGNYTYKHGSDSEDYQLYKKRSPIDFRVYAHFNKTLWQKISRQTDDFFDEVSYMKYILLEVHDFCNSRKVEIQVSSSRWNRRFRLTQTDCHNMKEDISPLLKKRYEELPPPKDGKTPSRSYC